MRAPTSRFANVAALLANGKPQPQWLVPDLERNSPLVGFSRNPGPGDEDDDRALLKAVQHLERWLVRQVKIYNRIEKEHGIPAPMILDETANKLFELTEFLENQLRPPRKGGPTPDSRK